MIGKGMKTGRVNQESSRQQTRNNPEDAGFSPLCCSPLFKWRLSAESRYDGSAGLQTAGGNKPAADGTKTSTHALNGWTRKADCKSALRSAVSLRSSLAPTRLLRSVL